MNTTGYSDAALAEAAAAIQKSQAYRAGKGEQFLNTLGKACVYSLQYRLLDTHRSSLGDKALAVSGSQVASTVQNAAASAAFDMVKEQVSHFVENSKILVSVLDEVGKAHPFVQSTLISPSSFTTVWC
jgi:hypothetical protein